MEIINGKITGIMLYDTVTSTVQIEGIDGRIYRLDMGRREAEALSQHLMKLVTIRIEISPDES